MRALPVLMTLLAAACAIPEPLEDMADVPEDGAAAYEGSCAPCHGASGRGDGPKAGALDVATPDLATLAVRHGGGFPRQYVIDVILGRRPFAAHGTPEMPAWQSDYRGGGPGAVAAAYAGRRRQLIADHLESLQRRE
jgi:mono/diheme cytochrome c family protein